MPGTQRDTGSDAADEKLIQSLLALRDIAEIYGSVDEPPRPDTLQKLVSPH